MASDRPSDRSSEPGTKAAQSPGTSHETEGPNPVDEARTIDEGYRERSWERERQFRAAITGAATYLALMASAAIQGIQPEGNLVRGAPTIRTAQFLLTVLAALVLRYAIGAIRSLSEAIVDDAARRHELELFDSRIAPVETRIADQNASLRRRIPLFGCRRRFLAALPRGGKSHRLAVVLGAVVATLPAAWFSLAPSRTLGLDVVVLAASSLCALAWMRLVLVGAKHWVWVDPLCGRLVRRPSLERPPRNWWLHRLSSDDRIAKALTRNPGLPVRTEAGPWPEECHHLYGTGRGQNGGVGADGIAPRTPNQ